MSHKYYTSKKEVIGWSAFLIIFSPAFFLPLYRPQVNRMDYAIISIFILTTFLLMAAAYWGFPEITNTHLEIRNVLYRFYRKRYAYDDIRKVVICRVPYHSPCVRIYLKSRISPVVHCLDSMDKNSIHDFLQDLQSHCIEIEDKITQ